MSQIALAHGATIDKYVGDAILIFFGDPETRGVKEDALACVTMAIEMRDRLKELENLWLESGLERPLQCRIGINTGLCTVGNFGSEDRLDYTIIGGGVNLAARLEEACQPNDILIAYETYAHIKDKIVCEKFGEINAKGINRPVATYRVIELNEKLDKKEEPLHAELPHLQVSVDINSMTQGEQQQAAAILRDMAAQISR